MNSNNYFMIDICLPNNQEKNNKKQNQLYLKSFAETIFLRLLKQELVRLCIRQKQTKGLLFFDPNIINLETYILQSNGWAINNSLFIHKCFQIVKTLHGFENITWRTTEDMAIPWGETKKFYKVFINILGSQEII